MTTIEIKQLEAFVRVAWASSYTLASHDLGITQSAVSARVAALEQELGVDLFVRSQGKVKLTPAGEELRAYAEEILRSVRIAAKSVREVSDDSAGQSTLRIGCNTATAAGPLARWLRRFRDGYGCPDLQVDVVVERTPVLMSMLMEGDIELALASPLLIDPLAQVLWSRHTSLALVAAGDRPWDGPTALTVADLAPLEFVAFQNGAARQQLWRLERMVGRPLHISFSSNSALLVRLLIAESGAVGFMPSEAVAEDLESGRLIELAIKDDRLETWESALVRWRDRPLSPNASALVAELPRLAEQ